jgi:hypothetical protein
MCNRAQESPHAQTEGVFRWLRSAAPRSGRECPELESDEWKNVYEVCAILRLSVPPAEIIINGVFFADPASSEGWLN